MWLVMTYRTPFGKKRGHTISTPNPKLAVDTFKERYQIHEILSLEIDGKKVDPKELSDELVYTS